MRGILLAAILAALLVPGVAQAQECSFIDKLTGTCRAEIAHETAASQAATEEEIARLQASARVEIANAEAAAQQAIEQAKLNGATDQLRLEKEIAAIEADLARTIESTKAGARQAVADVEAQANVAISQHQVDIARIDADTKITLAKLANDHVWITGLMVALVILSLLVAAILFYWSKRAADVVIGQPKVLPVQERFVMLEDGSILMLGDSRRTASAPKEIAYLTGGENT